MSSRGVYTNRDKAGERRRDDFYPTPWEATEALCRAELDAFQRFFIWEPACGDGAISDVLKRHACTVFSSDLVDRGYGHGGNDFLTKHARHRDGCGGFAPMAIITNPPFNLAEAFIRRSHDVGAPYIAMLLKANFFHAGTRLKLFHDHPPVRIYPLSWRLDFTGGGAPHTDCCWFIWDLAAKCRPMALYMPPLPKPDPLGLSGLTVAPEDAATDRKLSVRERGASARQMRMDPQAREEDAAFERYWRTLPPATRGRKSIARRRWAEARKGRAA